MVLGDGMSRVAPAHRISPLHPGTGWVVDDTGAADRVRADYWPDALIRELSQRYATEVHIDVTQTLTDDEMDRDFVADSVRKSRAPRKPRAPRQPRQPRQADVPQDGAA